VSAPISRRRYANSTDRVSDLALPRPDAAENAAIRALPPGIRQGAAENRHSPVDGGDMQERIARLESSVSLLHQEVGALRARIAVLEAGATLSPPVAVAATVIPEVDAALVEGWLALVGRTLVILGGAYLLRAMTSAQIVPYAAGVGAGLLYGAPWLLLAARAGSRGRLLDAFCYGVSTALIGYPLVWEATVRFAVFTPTESALLLGALTAAAFGLSAVWRLHSLAWIVTCGALASALGLAVVTDQWLPYTTLAIAVGLATLWLGYLRGWVLLRWPAALAADLMVVMLTGRPAGRFWLVLLVQVLPIAGYLGSFAARTLRKGRSIIPFEIAQSIGMLALILPSLFAFVAPRTFMAAVIVLLAGLATYAVSYTMVERRAPLVNLFFYSLLALVLTAAGVSIATPALAPVLLGAAGVAAAIAARRRAPVVLWVQAALLIAAAMTGSGLLSAASTTLTAPLPFWSAPGVTAWMALACGLAALAVAPLRHGPIVHGIAIARLALAVIAVWALSGAVVYVLGMALARTPGWGPAWLATLRTGVAVAVTLGTAYASRRDGWREAGWLTYPMLVLLGAKLLTSDFPSGGPLTLFIALAAYGTALIAAPRALRAPRRLSA
jgi:hypothetical protein